MYIDFIDSCDAVTSPLYQAKNVFNVNVAKLALKFSNWHNKRTGNSFFTCCFSFVINLLQIHVDAIHVKCFWRSCDHKFRLSSVRNFSYKECESTVVDILILQNPGWYLRKLQYDAWRFCISLFIKCTSITAIPFSLVAWL